MQVRANFNNSYLWRYAVFAVAGFGFALWCLYDLKVKYPSQLIHARKYEAMEKELDDAELASKWINTARENGWPTSQPRPSIDLEHAIEKQYFYGGLALLVGGIGLFYFSISCRSWIEMNSVGLRSRWGKKCDFENMVSMDKHSWEHKGIAKIIFEKDGLRQKFVLDDFKYERPQVDIIIRAVESRLQDDQILNGKREPDPNDNREEMIVDDESVDSEADSRA